MQTIPKALVLILLFSPSPQVFIVSYLKRLQQ
jgi:hypothetical protein